MIIQQKLNELHIIELSYANEIEILKDECEEDVRTLLGDVLYEQMVRIEDACASKITDAELELGDAVKKIQSSIKSATLQHGETVKADNYMAVFTQPKPAWDSAKLEGYAAAHPEILAFRKEKNPYVSIRKVKK